MLKIYGADLSSPANKVRFAANAMTIPYEYVRLNLREGEHKKDWYLKLHPAGKIPAMDDNGFFLFESNAIIKYLADKAHSSLYPKDLKERAAVDQWIDFSSMHVAMAMSKVVFNRVFYKRFNMELDERSLKDGLNFLNQFLPVVDAQLGKNNYLAGKNFTLADIVLLSALDPAEVASVDLSAYSHLTIWRNGLKKKEFYTQCYQEYGESLKAPAKA